MQHYCSSWWLSSWWLSRGIQCEKRGSDAPSCHVFFSAWLTFFSQVYCQLFKRNFWEPVTGSAAMHCLRKTRFLVVSLAMNCGALYQTLHRIYWVTPLHSLYWWLIAAELRNHGGLSAVRVYPERLIIQWLIRPRKHLYRAITFASQNYEKYVTTTSAWQKLNGLPSTNGHNSTADGLFAMNLTEDTDQYLIKTVSGTV